VGIRRRGEAEVAVERFLLLWDEVDELVGYGWHIAASMAHSVARRVRRPRFSPASSRAA
jgi:hypothetical protein